MEPVNMYKYRVYVLYKDQTWRSVEVMATDVDAVTEFAEKLRESVNQEKEVEAWMATKVN